jgi:nitrate reductase gamma subunit
LGGHFEPAEHVLPRLTLRTAKPAGTSVELMSGAPWTFQAHVLIVLALLGIWIYTRLAYMLSAPVGYPARPYLVYRS